MMEIPEFITVPSRKFRRARRGSIQLGIYLIFALALVACASPASPAASPIGSLTTPETGATSEQSMSSETQAKTISTPTAPQPTVTSAHDTETATPLLKVEPLFTASGLRLRFDSWAPNSQWITFWVGEADDLPAYLAFANVNSGETCQHDDVKAQDLGSGRVVWQEDGSAIAILNREGEAIGGVPCEAFASVDNVSLPNPYSRVDLSPDGRHLAERIILELEEQAFHTELRVTEVGTGRTIVSVPYIDSPHFVYGGPRWLNDELYLIGMTVDKGILYYSVSDDRVGNVFPDLLGLAMNDEQNVSTIGVQADPTFGEYHMLLGMSDQGALLFHSELDQAEELHFYPGSFADGSGGWRSFSPDGKWLLFLNDTPVGNGEMDYWLRAVDPPSSAPVKIADQASSGGLSSNGQLMAFFRQGNVLIVSFPEGRLLSRWQAPNYWLDRLWWSPDGSRLVTYGSHMESGQEALFVIEP